jgi:hypothetical protein
MMGETEYAEWMEPRELLSEVALSDTDDIVTWGLTASKMFTTSSLYKLRMTGGVAKKLNRQIWKCKVPLKVRIFLWQDLQDRLQTGQQLRAMGWKGSECCVLCEGKENADHLLFSCPMAEFLWAFC